MSRMHRPRRRRRPRSGFEPLYVLGDTYFQARMFAGMEALRVWKWCASGHCRRVGACAHFGARCIGTTGYSQEDLAKRGDEHDPFVLYAREEWLRENLPLDG